MKREGEEGWIGGIVFFRERSDAGEDRERNGKRKEKSLIREGELFGFTLITTVGFSFAILLFYLYIDGACYYSHGHAPLLSFFVLFGLGS